MVSLDYAPIVAAVTLALELAGKTATLTQRVASGDEDAPSYTPTETPVKCVDDQITQEDDQGVKRLRRVLYIQADAGVTPKEGDRIIVDSKEHQLYEVQTISPGNTVIIYTAFLEK